MNIVYLTLVDISQPTGPGTNELEFITTLQKVINIDNSKLHVITNELKSPLSRKIENHHCLIKKPLLIKGLSRFSLQWQYSFRFNSVIRSIEKEFGEIDLVISRFDSKWLFPILKKMEKRNIPFVIRHFHADLAKLSYNQASLLNLLGKAISIDTTWESKFKELKSLKINNVCLQHNSVNTEVFNLRDREKHRKIFLKDKFEFVIGYIGGFPLERGALELIELAGLLIKSNPKIGFLCIGDSKLKNDSHYGKIKELVREKSLENNFILQGYLPYEEIPQYFHLVDIGLALVPKEIALKYGNSSQKIFQYIASGAIAIVPEGTNQFLVEKGLAVSYEYEKGIKGLLGNVQGILSQSLPQLKYSRQERFEIIKDDHSKYAEIEKNLQSWKDGINNLVID